MGILSKWFGSSKQEETETTNEIEPEIDVQPLVKEELSLPTDIPSAVRYVVKEKGADYLANRGFLNILNDFQVLKDIPAAKHIIQNMQTYGYMEKIIQSSNWLLDSKSIAAKYSAEFGAKEDIVIYIVQSIGYGLYKQIEAPLFCDKEDVSQSQYNDPASQTINFHPQQNPQPTNSNSKQEEKKLISIEPYNYDPHRDYMNYLYPTLNLLNVYPPSDGVISIESILNTYEYQNSLMDLPCAIGKKENGEILMFDLATSPHLMISGSSGMGVTICFNTIITSLLYKKHPSDLKFVMIDPKKIEFSLYNPLMCHFLAGLPDSDPVMTNMGRVSELILSLSTEMENRLSLFKDAGVRNIKEYNRKFCNRKIRPVKGHGYKPYIVILIDEYDIISSSYGKVIETPLENISRNGRVVGMHLIISVQRAVGSVISAGIKANISSRISFRVTSINESRNILGIGGAERLQRPGDMIYTNGINIQKSRCAFIDTDEINRINDFIGSQQSVYTGAYKLPDMNLQNLYTSNSNDVDMNYLDPFFEDAARLVVFNQSGSTSMIQRKFAIGYNRANRLMDQLEKAGIVGVARGSAPREVLIHDEYSLNIIMASLR